MKKSKTYIEEEREFDHREDNANDREVMDAEHYAQPSNQSDLDQLKKREVDKEEEEKSEYEYYEED